ncbi:MAG: CvpA family protein [Verrucomicrobia bacterium]|nr:CvpA family protein [Verrucomicrobiota bacterium]
MPDWLSLVDVGFVAVALLFAWSGFQKGFAGQVAHILTFVIMGGVLFFAYPAIFSYFDRMFRSVDEIYLMWLILGGIVVLAILIFLLFCKILANLLKAQITEGADGAYGLVLGLIRGLLAGLFAMIFLVMLDSSGRVYDKFSSKSYSGKFVCRELVPRIQPRLAPALERNIQQIKNKLLEQEEGGKLE